MEKITAKQLRALNGNFGLACHIGGDRLMVTEVKNLTNVELITIKSRLTNERLIQRVLNEIVKRKIHLYPFL